MAGYSRNYIMARRGVGIADMQSVTLSNGDYDLEQAEANGIFRVNCTHQVGIATSTEVGLSADRFPIRVILCTNPSAIPQFMNETVCKYWRVTDIANAAIPFSRKPIATAIPVKNLYKYVPGLDNIMWSTYQTLILSAYTYETHADVDAVNSSIWDIISLTAPTDAQIAELPKLVDQLLMDCLAKHICPYIKIGENCYVRAEAHGRFYQVPTNGSAGKVALQETVICMMANQERLKRKYDDLSDGIITLAAYSVAAMFRHGLFESYEHREYYTVIVVPVVAKPNCFQVHSIRSPTGAPALQDITLGKEFDISGVRIKKQLVEVSNLLVMASGLMHYLFNHTTGGSVVTGTLLTILAMYQYINPTMAMETQTNITSLLYEALHPTNKRAIANLFFDNSGVVTHGRCATAPRYDRFEADSFFQIRTNPYPAGSHKAFICLQALKRVLQSGLAPFLPWAEQMNTCILTCKEVLTNGARAHIGSSYYTGDPPMAQPASLDAYLPELAQYVHTFNKGDSLSMSPHMSDEIAKRSSMNWQNLMKELKAKDVSATPVETVRGFLATSGSVHFTFDPSDQATWAKAVQDAKVAQDAITNIFI